MQQYLRPGSAGSRGHQMFDTWAATFGEVVCQIEMAPEGGSSFRRKPGSPGSRTSRRCCAAARLRRHQDRPTISSCPSRPWPPSRRRPARPGNRHQSSPPTNSSTTARTRRPGWQDPLREVARMRTTCSRSPGTAAGPRWTCGCSACRRPPRARSRQPPPDRRLWDGHRDESTWPRTGSTSPVRGILQLVFCDMGTPATGLERLRRAARPAHRPRPAARRDPVRPRRENRPRQGASCSPRAAPAPSPC